MPNVHQMIAGKESWDCIRVAPLPMAEKAHLEQNHKIFFLLNQAVESDMQLDPCMPKEGKETPHMRRLSVKTAKLGTYTKMHHS